ncbi:hypothetical protein TNCV_2151191 [Trichonephila clavipes]|nr:hypothetical protein TNCV_2151191 [Trichonephila clavipes]
MINGQHAPTCGCANRDYDRPTDCLDSERIQRLVWPGALSRSMPIENVWDALGRQVAGRNYPPTKQEHPHPCTHREMG